MGAKAQGGSIKRLFGTPRDYESNIRELLEMRLSQIIRPVSTRLHKLVRDSIANLPDDPDDCLNNLTRIEELSLDMVWQVESDSNRMLPSSVISVWTLPPLDKDTTVSWRMAAKREEITRTGVYVLAGPDPENPSQDMIYVGEGDNVFKRIAAHDKDVDKEFWVRCVAVISKDLTQSQGGWSVDHLQRGLPRESRLRPRHQARVPQLG